MSDETTVSVGEEEVRISSPGRVIFPKQGWTKLDMATHFAMVSEGALRGVFGRPTMLKRYMGTVDEDPIYHKRAAKNTPFETVQIKFPSQRPGVMNVPRTEADRSTVNCSEVAGAMVMRNGTEPVSRPAGRARRVGRRSQPDVARPARHLEVGRRQRPQPAAAAASASPTSRVDLRAPPRAARSLATAS